MPRFQGITFREWTWRGKLDKFCKWFERNATFIVLFIILFMWAAWMISEITGLKKEIFWLRHDLETHHIEFDDRGEYY